MAFNLATLDYVWVSNQTKLFEEKYARLLLVSGAIRQFQNELSHIHTNNILHHMPTTIIKIITDYHYKIRIGFNIYNETFCCVTKSYLIRSCYPNNCQRLLVSNIGLNKDINKWKIRCKSSFQHTLIGVIGDLNSHQIKRIQTLRPWINNNEFTIVYYWDKYGQDNQQTNSRNIKIHTHTEKKRLIDVTVTLDCNANELTVMAQSVNRKQEKTNINQERTISIKKGITYYPFLAFYHKDDEYQMIYCNDLNCWECNEMIHGEQQTKLL
eukprot:308637_1